MIQAIDCNFDRPVYNSVNIKIRRPEVNAGGNKDLSLVTDNGIYNAVKIDIDNPAINTEPKPYFYNYPQAQEIVTYDMANINPIVLPTTLPVKECEDCDNIETIPSEDVAEDIPDENNVPEVPAPNFTTLENEKKNNDSTVKSELSFKAVQETKLKRPEIIPGEEIKPDVDIQAVVRNAR